jgi:hypothetical protein
MGIDPSVNGYVDNIYFYIYKVNEKIYTRPTNNQ